MISSECHTVGFVEQFILPKFSPCNRQAPNLNIHMLVLYNLANWTGNVIGDVRQGIEDRRIEDTSLRDSRKYLCSLKAFQAIAI